MDPEKLMDMQRQVCRNNDDLQSFLNDLDSWESDIKKKDENLKESKAANPTAIPPVRNSLEQKRRKKKKKATKERIQKPTKTEKQRISGYDFISWDKFDVDKACEEIDEKSGSSASEYETDEEWEVERKKLLANQRKDEGNQLFKEGQYARAIENYTKAIELYPANAVFPANRAMALIKQEQYAAAELDCTRALSLDDSYLKAYHRRGTARASLKRYQEAKQDFEKVLKHEPKNKQAKQELEKIERLLNPPIVLETKGIEVSDVVMVKAIYKPPARRSKKPLKRITIEEIGEDEETERRRQQISNAQAQQSATKQRLTAEDDHKFQSLITTTSKPVPTTDISVAPQPTNCMSLTNGLHSSKPLTKLAHDESEGSSVKTGKISTESSSPRRESSAIEKGEVTAKPASCRVPPVPSTSYQFQADWKTLKNTQTEFYDYFKAIPPSLLPKLFGQSVDSDVLAKIFNTMKDFYISNGDDLYKPLRFLCDVARFSMTVMFMSSTEKKVLAEIFQHLENSTDTTKADIAQLKRKYQL